MKTLFVILSNFFKQFVPKKKLTDDQEQELWYDEFSKHDVYIRTPESERERIDLIEYSKT